MNMILHDNPTAQIKQGNTLANPLFTDGDAAQDLRLRRRQSALPRQALEHRPRRRATTRIERFKHYGIPPAKQGDYAYLLHILRSLKSTGKGACILPHGVLFRGNAEARDPQESGPARLHQGHHRPAGQLVLRHRHPRLHHRAGQGGRPRARKGIFMIDARKGFMQGRPEEPPARAGHPPHRRHLHPPGGDARLRRAWCRWPRSATQRTTTTSTCRATSTAPSPRTCRTSTATCAAASPTATSTPWADYWQVFPACAPRCSSRPAAPATSALASPPREIKTAIFGHAEFTAFIAPRPSCSRNGRRPTPAARGFAKGGHPKALIETIAEALLAAFREAPLLDAYDVYQHLMDYWAETMQDDCYLIAADGWVAAAQPR